jgi:hypothetical protein
MTSTFDHLPGGDLISQGISDGKAGKITVESCLVAIGAPRLLRSGLTLEGHVFSMNEPQQRLYQLLRQTSGDAYARYNALIRRLISFQHALDRRSTCP